MYFRTEEQIREQLAARLEVIRKEELAIAEENEKPYKTMPCSTCRFNKSGFFCSNPLIVGTDKGLFDNYDRELRQYNGPRQSKLCGHEKALWMPKGLFCGENIASFLFTGLVLAVAGAFFSGLGWLVYDLVMFVFFR